MWANERTCPCCTDRTYLFSCFMANRMGLDGTMPHYLAVRKAMVSVHRPVCSKITLTYSLSWQTDRCTPRRMAFKALLNAKTALSQALLCAYCSKKLPERAPTKTQLSVDIYCRLLFNYMCGHIDDPPTLN